MQGLGDMKTHMSRLEKDRAAAAAKKAAGISSPAVESRLPSYMRQTAASVAMQKARRASLLSLDIALPALSCACSLHHSRAPWQRGKRDWFDSQGDCVRLGRMQLWPLRQQGTCKY